MEVIAEEFMKLRQEDPLEEYQDSFEALRIRMESVMPALMEAFSSSGFIEGLKDEIQLVVRMFIPTTLTQAIEIARLQNQLLVTKKFKPLNRTFSMPSRSTMPPNSSFSSSKILLSLPSRPQNPDQNLKSIPLLLKNLRI